MYSIESNIISNLMNLNICGLQNWAIIFLKNVLWSEEPDDTDWIAGLLTDHYVTLGSIMKIVILPYLKKLVRVISLIFIKCLDTGTVLWNIKYYVSGSSTAGFDFNEELWCKRNT